jgi:hypothetical protein
MREITKPTTELVDALEVDLMAARKSGEVVAFLIPFGEDYTAAIRVGQDLVDRLRQRGLTIQVTTARADNGLAMLLADATPVAAA